MTKRKFYKTIISMRILSEDPIPRDLTITEIIQECDSGSFVGDEMEHKDTELNGKQAVAALYDVGSEPGFFRLNDRGGDRRD